MAETYKSISLEEAKKLVEENVKNENFVVIDVRTPEELSGGVIGQPINIDIYSHDFSQRINELDKKKTYLVYCRSGNRSKTALEIMKQLGFENVYEIDCGIAG